jgi:Transposase and inactivated derivatives
MDDYRLSDKEIIQLKQRHRKAKTKREADRLKAVYLLGEGWEPKTVAHILDKDDRTILSYFQHYKDGGSDQLLQNNYHGKEPKLSELQEQELSEHLRNTIYRSSIDIIHFVRITFKVTFSRTGIKHLLKRLNFTYHKPKIVPGKSDTAKQKAWLRYYRWLRTIKGKTAVFLFGDACHPQGNGEPSYGWIYKGEEKQLKSNSGRQHLNLNGVIDIDTLDITMTMPSTVNAQSMIELGKQILKKYLGEKTIYWIVDNANYHRAKIFKEWLRGQPCLVVLFLPSYSPNLNLMERLWKFFNEQVRCNKYFECFSDFVLAAKNFFRCRTKFKEKLRSRLAEKFQLF